MVRVSSSFAAPVPIPVSITVWVALLSAWIFGDRINAWKVAGIAIIILGVALLGRASMKDGYKAPE